MNIGMKLKELREENNKTQQQIADILLCSRIVYNRYENNKRQIPLECLSKLAIYYQVSLDYIFGNEDEFGNKKY